MTDLRTAAQQALEALELAQTDVHWELNSPTRKFLRKAEKNLRAALAEPVHEPEEFDHGIGANRFKVVRGAFWWHVLIGDSPTEHGKFRSRAGAEKMAADLLREFRNGAFVQHKAAPPQRKPLTDQQKLDLVTNWFAEDWAINKALGLLHDYDIKQAQGIGGKE